MVTIKNTKIDLIRMMDSMILHQQIERREGLTFMRMKKLPFLKIK